MRPRATVGDYMQPKPFTVGEDQPLGVAHDLMRFHGVRHLPVTSKGRLVGVLSQRDLLFLEQFAGADPAVIPVSKAMRTDVYVTGPGTPLDEVARMMGKRKLGSALVVEGDHVLGVFTTTDALRALEDVVAQPSMTPRRTRGQNRRKISHPKKRRREARH